MPNEYTLSDLVKLTGTTPRTVRYYIAQGLLQSPTQQGPNARYSDVHLDRLRAIKRLQAAHLPLAEIRKQLDALPADELASLAESATGYPRSSDSALEYIDSILHGRRGLDAPAAAPAPAAASMPAPSSMAPQPPAARTFARAAASGPAAPAAPAAASAPIAPPPAEAVKPRATEPDRAQWERVVLDPDVELHIRRPLTRHQNKNVERLISIARQLLEE